MLTAPAIEAAALSPYSIPTKSSTARGRVGTSSLTPCPMRGDCAAFPLPGRRRDRAAVDDRLHRNRARQGGGEVQGRRQVAQVDGVGGPAGRGKRGHRQVAGDVQVPERGGDAVAGELDRGLLAGPGADERGRALGPRQQAEPLLLGGPEYLPGQFV